MLELISTYSNCIALPPLGSRTAALLIIFLSFSIGSIWVARHPSLYGKSQFQLANVVGLAWLLLSLMADWTANPVCKDFWLTGSMVAMALAGSAWCLFVYYFAKGDLIPTWSAQWYRLLLLPLAIVAGAIVLDSLWTLSPASQIADTASRQLFLETTSRAVFFTAVLGSLMMLVVGFSSSEGMNRVHFAILMVVTSLPALVNLIEWQSGLELYWSNPTATVFVLSAIGYAALKSFDQMFQISVAVKDKFFNSMINPVLVVDDDGRVQMANESAVAMFGPVAAMGGLLSQLPDLADIPERMAGSETVLDVTVGEHEFEVRTTRIIRQSGRSGRSGTVMAWALQFFEVTAHRSAQRDLTMALRLSNEQLEQVRTENQLFAKEMVTDPLTGLLNRRTITAEFRRIAKGRNGAAADCMVTVIDVDHFKTINDRFGHAAGDKVLLHLAKCLRLVFRNEDRLFRFGGEEFVILSPGLDLDTLSDRIASLWAMLDETAADLGIPDIEIRFSAGIAATKSDAWALSDLIEIADDRLYRAKRTGRGRTIGPFMEMKHS